MKPLLKDKKRLIIFIFSILMFIVGAIGLIVTTATAKFYLSDDSYTYSEDFVDITGEEYEQMLSDKKSFLVLVDQDGCITAAGLKSIASDIAKDKHLTIYRIMFSDARNTSMHDSVKYYPSFAIISSGKIVSWLKADADEDTERYKDRTALETWLSSYIEWKN